MRHFYLFSLFFIIQLVASEAFSQITMQGKVVNNRGVELVGALLELEDDIAHSTITDVTGMYKFRLPESFLGSKIVVSYSGYQPDTIVVTEGTRNVILKAREKQMLKELYVSTQKRVQREVDVPIAVSVLTDDKINVFNIDHMDEMARFVPGFSNTYQDNSSASYCIRGVYSDGVESYFQQRISVFLDGLPINRVQTSLIELYDMQRVEVLKGPQGTLYGRGAEVGAVHYVRNQPEEFLDFNAFIKYGLYNERIAGFMVNTPFGSKVANRLAVRYSAHDGYVRNLLGGRLNGYEAVAAKNATSFFISDKQKLTFTFDMLYNHDPSTNFKTSRIGTIADPLDVSPFTDACLNNHGRLGLERSVYNGILQYDYKLSENVNVSNTLGYSNYNTYKEYDSDGSYIDILYGNDKVHGQMLSEEFRLNWTNGSSLHCFAGMSYVYENNTHDYFIDGDPTYQFPIIVGPSIRKGIANLPGKVGEGVLQAFDELGSKIKQNVPGMDDAVDELVGSFKNVAREGVERNLDVLYDKLYLQSDRWERTPDLVKETSDVITNMLTYYVEQVMDQNPLVKQVLTPVLNGKTVSEFIESMNIAGALAGDPQITAISNVTLPESHSENMRDRCRTHELGVFADVAWDFARKFCLTMGIRGTYETMSTLYRSSSGVVPILNDAILFHSSNGNNMYVENDYASWVGRLILNWKFDPTHNLYASLSKGRRPGLVYFDLSPYNVVSLKPEILYNYELGIKGISKYRYFSYHVAFYYYDWLNFQSSWYGDKPDGTKGYITNDGGKARGFGLDGSLLYTFNPYVSTFINYSYCNGRFSGKDMDGNIQKLSGNRFRLNPEHMFDMGLNWRPKFLKGAYICPDIQVTSKVYFTDANSEDLMQKSYTLLNMNLGYRWQQKNGKINYDLGIYGKNLFGAEYLVDAGNTGEAFGYPTFVSGAPLTCGAVFRMSLNTAAKAQ